MNPTPPDIMAEAEAIVREIMLNYPNHLTKEEMISMVSAALSRRSAQPVAGYDEIPDGWQIESIIAEKLRVPIEDYECVLCHPERMCDLSDEPYKVHGIGNTIREAVLNAISKIPVARAAGKGA